MRSGTIPLGPHRMADPWIRVRALLAAALLLAATWGAIAVAGDRGCAAFERRELRELAGLPIPPACVQRQIPPANPIDRLQQQLQNPASGATP